MDLLEIKKNSEELQAELDKALVSADPSVVILVKSLSIVLNNDAMAEDKEFSSFLLKNDDIKKQLLGIFSQEIYRSLRDIQG